MNKNKRPVVSGLGILLVGGALVTACGPANTSATKGQATQAASAADTQLVKDGYTPVHIPGFGRVDAGIGNGTYRYEAIYTGKNPEVIKTVSDTAAKHPEKGVQISSNGVLLVVKADNLKDLKTAASTVAKSLR